MLKKRAVQLSYRLPCHVVLPICSYPSFLSIGMPRHGTARIHPKQCATQGTSINSSMHPGARQGRTSVSFLLQSRQDPCKCLINQWSMHGTWSNMCQTFHASVVKKSPRRHGQHAWPRGLVCLPLRSSSIFDFNMHIIINSSITSSQVNMLLNRQFMIIWEYLSKAHNYFMNSYGVKYESCRSWCSSNFFIWNHLRAQIFNTIFRLQLSCKSFLHPSSYEIVFF
jgi:hypothetical protein